MIITIMLQSQIVIIVIIMLQSHESSSSSCELACIAGSSVHSLMGTKSSRVHRDPSGVAIEVGGASHPYQGMRLHFITSRAGLYCFDWHFQFGLKLIIIGKASPPFSPSLRCQLQWTLILSKSRAGSVLSHSHTILWSCRCTCGFNCADHFEKMSEEIPSCWCTRQSIVHRGAALALWHSGDDDVEE